MASTRTSGRTRTLLSAALAVIVAVVIAIVLVGGAFVGGRAIGSHSDAALPTTADTSAVPTPSAVLAAGATPPAPSATTAADAPVAAKLAQTLAPLLAAPALGGLVHAMLADAASGAGLLDSTSTTPAPPASTTKLVTAAAVLARFPAATARLTTTARSGATPAEVVLVGGGDPTLSAAAAGQPSIYPRAGRLSDLAAQILAARKNAGITAPITSIVVDGTLFTGDRTGPGWAPDDVPTSYASAITAVMVDGGLPATGGAVRSATPDVEAGRALAVLLGAPGASVVAGQANAGSTELGHVESAPMLDLVEQMLSNSDNVIAETLGRAVALAEHQPASFAGAAAGIRAALASVGVTVPPTLVDASGLSTTDRLTPALLVTLLHTVLDGSHPALQQLVSALPIAGWEGTLATRYQVPPTNSAAGDVRAKTGTLSGVVTLAGMVRDATGRLLIFAFMADRVPDGGTETAEAAIDAAAAGLAACGCR